VLGRLRGVVAPQCEQRAYPLSSDCNSGRPSKLGRAEVESFQTPLPALGDKPPAFSPVFVPAVVQQHCGSADCWFLHRWDAPRLFKEIYRGLLPVWMCRAQYRGWVCKLGTAV